MLVNMKEMLNEANKKNIAVGAFNCATLESARAALMAAEELGIPLILQHAEVHEEYIPMEISGPIMLNLAKNASVPVCVHLDHGSSIESVTKAIRMGFTSVMIDASSLEYEENIKLTEQVVKIAHSVDVTVEAELGNMPHNLKGELGEYRPEDFYTIPEQAAKFKEKTNVDAMAISFGTVHGVYKCTPKLDFSIVEKVSKATDSLPLVMHGGSGLSDSDYENAIKNGIRKINYYTYEAMAGGRGVYSAVKEKPEGLQFHEVAACATEYMRQDVLRVMKLFSGIKA